jgi:glycosyltransferase involved in cell wall biosynthesis
MGIDERWFRPAEDRERRRRELKLEEGRLHLLFAGDLDPWKGIGAFAAALAAAEDLAGKVRLHIAGAGSLRPELERLEQASNGAVRLLGLLPQEELARWYQAADLLVLPSRGEGAPVRRRSRLQNAKSGAILRRNGSSSKRTCVWSFPLQKSSPAASCLSSI